MILSSLKKSSGKEIREQTVEEKMYLLKLIANQALGQKWIFYKKIKTAGGKGKLFKAKSLTDEMKATQSALKFTSKNASKLYRLVYQNSVNEIKSYTGLKEGFPELPEEQEGGSPPPLTSDFDAVIIAWTPIKFLLTSRQIREKGIASQRHTEGLLAKLYFKVVGYYATPENWNIGKLTMYLNKIKQDSTYQQVVQALEPLKKDLLSFSEQYELFKFGKANLQKDSAQDADAYDDAFEEESFESQVKSLFWHNFIYQAMEQFLFRYYLTLITATSSATAVHYLTLLFEPALKQSIENKHVFLGSFDTDVSKRPFRVQFEAYRKQRREDALLKKIKTQKGIFNVYNYNLNLLDTFGINFNLLRIPHLKSAWWKFTRHNILGIDRPVHKIGPEEDNLVAENPDDLKAKEQLIMLAPEKNQLAEELQEVDHDLDTLNKEKKEMEKSDEYESLIRRKRHLGKEKESTEIKLINLEKDKRTLFNDLKIINNKIKKIDQTGALSAENKKDEQKDKELKDLKEQLEDKQRLVKKGDINMLYQRKKLKKIATAEAEMAEKETRHEETARKITEGIKKADRDQQRLSKKLEEIVRKIDNFKKEEQVRQAELQQKIDKQEKSLNDLNKFETRAFALMHIMSTMIDCSRHRKEARQKILERFKERVSVDKTLAEKQIAQARKEADKKIREMTKKVSKLKRLKQTDAANDFANDITKFKEKTDTKCKTILANSKSNMLMQRERLKKLFANISREKRISEAGPSKMLLKLTDKIDPENAFSKKYKRFVPQDINQRYVKDVEQFYKHAFEILEPTLFEKVAFIQALSKTGADGGVRLSLNESEERSFEAMIKNMKERIGQQTPGIFDYEITVSSARVRIDDLFKLRIDNGSLKMLMNLKVSSRRNPKPMRLSPAIANSLLSLNNVINPVPHHSILLAGRENDKNPLNAINKSQLNTLLSNYAPK